MSDDKKNTELNKNLSAIIFLVCFLLAMIVITTIIIKIKDAGAPTDDNNTVVEETAEIESTDEQTSEAPVVESDLTFNELIESLYSDVNQILTCNDVHYFSAITPGIFMTDLAPAREILGKCEPLSYTLWKSSEFSTALNKGQYLLDIKLSGSGAGYDEVLVYFYVQEYDGKCLIESVSFEYLSID